MRNENLTGTKVAPQMADKRGGQRKTPDMLMIHLGENPPRAVMWSRATAENYRGDLARRVVEAN